MKISLSALLALTALALVANMSAVTSSEAQTANKRLIIIEMYGDSTTLGAQTAPDGTLITTNNSEPNQLQDLLQQKFGTQVVVYNNGVGGTEAYQLLSGLDGRNREWSYQAKTSQADIVIFNYALNDQYYYAAPSPKVYSETPDMYGNILAWLIQTSRDNGKYVVLQEPNPTCYQPTVGNLQKFVDVLRATATVQNVPLVAEYDYIQTLPNWKSMYTDCAHPDDQLYGIKAQRTFDVVAPIVQQMLSN